MIIKQGKATITQVARHPNELLDQIAQEVLGNAISNRLRKKLAGFKPIELDPDRFLYIRNRAISAEESWGYNQNFDAWTSAELKAGCRTFVNAQLDIDHDPSLPIGNVIDSFMIPKAVVKPGVEGEVNGVKVPILSAFTSYDALEHGDQVTGDWIENVWAINKQSINGFYPNAVEAIMDGEITDTSMGCEVSHTCCSICGNKATEPEEYCEHIGRWGVNKGSEWDHPVTGHKVVAYESCYGVQFFEDSLIMPEQWNRVKDSQGADVNAKLLEIIALKHSSYSERDQKMFAGQLRTLYSCLSDDNKKAFTDILSTLQ